MASLELRSGRYRIVFRFGGQKFHHSLGTTDRTEAEASAIGSRPISTTSLMAGPSCRPGPIQASFSFPTVG